MTLLSTQEPLEIDGQPVKGEFARIGRDYAGRGVGISVGGAIHF